VEEKEVTVEKRTTVRRDEPLGKTTNVNKSGGDPVVEEEHVVEEHHHQP
jgi:hypothetical protein